MKNLKLATEGILDLTYTELKILADEVVVQLDCWGGDKTKFCDILTDAAKMVNEDVLGKK